jgi:hypothetical protein
MKRICRVGMTSIRRGIFYSSIILHHPPQRLRKQHINTIKLTKAPTSGGQALREVPVAGQQCLSANRRVLHTVKRDATNLFSMRDANKKRRKRKGVEVRRKEEECML